MSGNCVVFSVSDTAKGGIAADILPYIFEPFFSTKPPGKGTGLGLPTVRRIVEAHHGLVTVSTTKEGSKFEVFIPAAPSAGDTEEAQRLAFNGGGLTVLLVDDQASFRDLAQMQLERLGFKVITAANGPEALNFFRTGHKIDALLTDLAMPIMTGTELARNLRSNGHTVPIIYLSGHDASPPHDPEPQAVVQKPFTSEQLMAKLKQVLTSPVAPNKPSP
jgi:CheY-like chemotaxis protein